MRAGGVEEEEEAWPMKLVRDENYSLNVCWMFVEENITTFHCRPWTGSPVLVLPDEQARAGAHMSVILNEEEQLPISPELQCCSSYCTLVMKNFHLIKATEIPELGAQGSDIVSGGSTE